MKKICSKKAADRTKVARGDTIVEGCFIKVTPQCQDTIWIIKDAIAFIG